MLCDHCKGPRFGVMIYTCRNRSCDDYNVGGWCYEAPEPRYNDTGYLLACDLKKELEKNSLTGYLSACEDELFHCSYCKYPTRDCKEIYYEDEEYYTCSQYEPSREKMIDHYADEPGMKEPYRSLLNKMIEDEKIEEVKEEEPKVKDVADIMKRYMESQQELMEMISTLFIRLNKFKEI